jgi:hypothetical protein
MGQSDTEGKTIVQKTPTKDMQIAFVQDISASKWIAYIAFWTYSGSVDKYKQELKIPDGFVWKDVDKPVSFFCVYYL